MESPDSVFENDDPSYKEDLEQIAKLREEIELAKKEKERLRIQMAEAGVRLNKMISFRVQAKQFEAENKLSDAISIYLLSLQEAEQSPIMHPNFFANDIDKVIALYHSTNQIELLKTFLEEKIRLYPGYFDTKKWVARHSELQGEK